MTICLFHIIRAFVATWIETEEIDQKLFSIFLYVTLWVNFFLILFRRHTAHRMKFSLLFFFCSFILLLLFFLFHAFTSDTCRTLSSSNNKCAFYRLQVDSRSNSCVFHLSCKHTHSARRREKQKGGITSGRAWEREKLTRWKGALSQCKIILSRYIFCYYFVWLFRWNVVSFHVYFVHNFHFPFLHTSTIDTIQFVELFQISLPLELFRM